MLGQYGLNANTADQLRRYGIGIGGGGAPQQQPQPVAPPRAPAAAPPMQSRGFGIPANIGMGGNAYANALRNPPQVNVRSPGLQQAPGAQAPQQAPQNYSSLGEGANQNLAGGRSVYGHQIGEDTWTNPQFNPDQNAEGYTRFDETQRGSGLERAKTFDDGASIYDAYAKQGNPAAIAADEWMAEQGINPATATAEQKFDAMDQHFRSKQKKNERPKRSFGIKDLAGMALSAGGGFFGPWGAAIGSTLGSKLGGSSWGDSLLSGGTSFAKKQFPT